MKKINKIDGQVPSEFKKFFWDVDFDQLDIKEHRKFILERFLNYGTYDTFSWIFNSFSSEEVKDFIKIKGETSLSRNSYLFWKKIAQSKSLWKNN